MWDAHAAAESEKPNLMAQPADASPCAASCPGGAEVLGKVHGGAPDFLAQTDAAEAPSCAPDAPDTLAAAGEANEVEIPLCAADCPGNPAALDRVRAGLPDDEILYDLAELFRVFGDSTRIKILYVLFESELCVGDIAQVLGVSQSAVSHQLRLLKSAKLVRFRRDGKTVYYALDDDHVRSIIALGMEHVEE